MGNNMLIGYDIASPKRLGKLYRSLHNYGVPIQYSLFLCNLTKTRLKDCIKTINSIIDLKHDDVRLYFLPENTWSCHLGRTTLPDGIFYTNLPTTFEKSPNIDNNDIIYDISTEVKINKTKKKKKNIRYDATTRKIISSCQTKQKNGILYIR